MFAAGNCGSGCPDQRCERVVADTITGANASRDVLTIAGCDVSGARVGYSSQGPAIPGMAPRKPDIAAFTHFMGSEALGPGKADIGTSAACPVAAGCIAALRTSPRLSSALPAVVFDALRKTAHRDTDVDWNPDYGYGIIDPVAAAKALELIATS